MRFLYFEGLIQDLRFAIRGMRNGPAFTSVAITSLALGIGANTAIFSFVNAVLLKHLPVPEPGRLVQLHEFEGNKDASGNFSYPFIRELALRNPVFDGLFGRFPVRVSLTSAGIAEPLQAEVVTGQYFETLRIRPALGRLLTEQDVPASVGNPVCVISYSMWQQRFGGDPGILARTLLLNGRPYRVVGVTEKGFAGSQLQSQIEMQIPVSRMNDFMGGAFAGIGITWESPGFSWLEPLGRLKPGMTPRRAEAMLQPLARQIAFDIARPADRTQAAGNKYVVRLLDGRQGFNYARSTFAEPVLVSAGVAGLVLLIACANLANLLLAKASVRESEFAVRASLGATRSRLIRQLLVESLALAITGGILGVAISYWVVDALLLILNQGASTPLRVAPDATVLWFSAAVTLVAAILFGLAPAWQLSSPNVPSRWKEGARATSGRDTVVFRKALIAVQIALSLVMLFAAGLLTHTLRALQTIDLGFKPAEVVALSVDPTMNGYPQSEAMRIYDEILSRLRAARGIGDASFASVSPLEGGAINLSVEVPGYTGKTPQPAINLVSPGYFATLNQQLLAGRDFSDHDGPGRHRVCIINDLFAARYMPRQNPLGRRLKEGGGDMEIVGVVKAAKYQELREAPQPVVYMSWKQGQSSGYTLLVRAIGDSGVIIPLVEHTIHSIDPKTPTFNVRTLQAQIEHGISSERVLSFLSTLFSALATLLCAIGIYGVLAYAVSRRTREIGVRFAVGAQKSDITKLFLRDSFAVVAIGICFGIPVALASARVLASLLYGIKPHDPATLILASGILAVSGLLATLLPLRRAAAVSASEALRHE